MRFPAHSKQMWTAAPAHRQKSEFAFQKKC